MRPFDIVTNVCSIIYNRVVLKKYFALKTDPLCFSKCVICKCVFTQVVYCHVFWFMWCILLPVCLAHIVCGECLTEPILRKPFVLFSWNSLWNYSSYAQKLRTLWINPNNTVVLKDKRIFLFCNLALPLCHFNFNSCARQNSCKAVCQMVEIQPKSTILCEAKFIVKMFYHQYCYVPFQS